jgi:hypothetical protein
LTNMLALSGRQHDGRSRSLRHVGSNRGAGPLLCLAIVVAGCNGSVPTLSPEPLASPTARPPFPSLPSPVATPVVAPSSTPTPTGRPGTFTASGQTDLPNLVDTAALLNDGEVIVIGEGAAALLDPATGQFRSTGSPLPYDVPYGPNLSIALQDGRVLTFNDFNAQLYDPSTGEFTLAAAEPGSHRPDAAVLLPDGRLLCVGGYALPRGATPLADIYDPATGKFTRADSMRTARHGETATLLRDGRVLVAGGDDGGEAGGYVFASAELYDPTSGKWTRTGSMTTPRVGASATLLINGEVLVAGGRDADGGFLVSAELYDPATGRFTKTGSMSVPRTGHTATRLRDGRVLVADGSDENGDPIASADLYDPTTGRFAPTGPMAAGSEYGTAILLADGRVLVVYHSGLGTVSADLYWP